MTCVDGGAAAEASIGDIVDSCRIWESHAEPVAMDSGRQDPFDSQPTLRKPLPVTFGSARVQHKVGSVMPAVSEPPPRVTHSLADRELLIQNVLEAVRSRRNIIPERSQERELEFMLCDTLPVRSVTEAKTSPPASQPAGGGGGGVSTNERSVER